VVSYNANRIINQNCLRTTKVYIRKSERVVIKGQALSTSKELKYSILKFLLNMILWRLSFEIFVFKCIFLIGLLLIRFRDPSWLELAISLPWKNGIGILGNKIAFWEKGFRSPFSLENIQNVPSINFCPVHSITKISITYYPNISHSQNQRNWSAKFCIKASRAAGFKNEFFLMD